MELNFTNDEFAFLKQFEDRFRCAVYADWARKPNPIAVKTMLQIWDRVTGRETRLRESCQHCVLTFLKEVGTAYFVDKAERDRRAAEAKAKEESMRKAEAKPVKATQRSENEPKASGVANSTQKKKQAVKTKKTAKKK